MLFTDNKAIYPYLGSEVVYAYFHFSAPLPWPSQSLPLTPCKGEYFGQISYLDSPLLLSGFPGGTVVKNLPTSAVDEGSIPGWGRSPGEGNGNPLQFSWLKDTMDRGALKAMVQGVTKSQTWLSNWEHNTFTLRRDLSLSLCLSTSINALPSLFLYPFSLPPSLCILSLPFLSLKLTLNYNRPLHTHRFYKHRGHFPYTWVAGLLAVTLRS